jgi:hypothetical protein
MRRLVVLACLTAGCGDGGEHPPRRAFAGRLTEANFESERVPGPASQGLPGDFFLRNDRVHAVIQAPGRAMGPCPWGGTLLDLDFVGQPLGDQLGEVAPQLGIGRTANFTTVEVVSDGSDGGPAVVRARGPDAINDFVNMRGIAGFLVAAIAPHLDPQLPLGLELTATYTLAPGDAYLTVEYQLLNTRDQAQSVAFGTITDSGAQIEIFHPGFGYGEGANTAIITGGLPTVEYLALQGQGLSYGVIPLPLHPDARGAALPVGGVATELYDEKAFGDAFTDAGRTVALGPKGLVKRTVVVAVARGGAGAIEGVVRTLKGQASAPIAIEVRGDAAAGARVAVARADESDPLAALVTTFVAGADGRASGALAPGRYTAAAEGPSWLRSPVVSFTVVAGATTPTTVTLPLPPSGRLSYRVTDETGAPIPAKISVVGAPAAAPDSRFRDVTRDPLPYGLAAWLASRGGDATLGTDYDHPIPLALGRYRVVVSRGPEWSRYEQVVDLGVGNGVATVTATLRRVLDTRGYLACDFHQHTHKSPDSPVPPEDRVITNLADGVEYLSSSEHDVVFDYGSIIDAFDARGLLDSGIGVETTPFDYGHFIGYPLVVDPMSPNGGAFDWGTGGMGDLTPKQILAGLRAQGARVVQVNHPRTPPLAVSFQQNFDRAALRFDFAARTFYSDTSLLEVSARDLGLPEDASLFSSDFNALEVYLGFHPGPDPTVVDRERQEVLVNTILRDWMNFLSFGFTPTAVGDSDTHSHWSAPAGLPRNLVRVPDDSEAAIYAGVGADVARPMSGESPRDVIVTNGPMATLAVGPDLAAGGMGRTVALPAGATTLPVHVEVQSAEWAPFDTVEIYANASFTVPPPPGQQLEPLVPALCFTARATPSWRCTQAIGGARALSITPVDVGGGARRLEARVDVSASIAELLGRQRAGATGRDLWLVARVAGQTGLFPVIPAAVDSGVPLADLIAGKPLVGEGVPALAFTNPVFVDVDGNGWRGPFQP